MDQDKSRQSIGPVRFSQELRWTKPLSVDLNALSACDSGTRAQLWLFNSIDMSPLMDF